MKLPLVPNTQASIDHAACGKLIRDLRQSFGLTLTEVAWEMDIPVSVLCMLELGDRQWTEARFNLAEKTIREMKGKP
jgi:predicted transcriptional regulator